MTTKKVCRYQEKKRMGLVPHIYSDAYRRWHAQAKKGSGNSVANAEADHRAYLKNRYGERYFEHL